MNQHDRSGTECSELMQSLEAEEVWQFRLIKSGDSPDAALAALAALQQPLDYPPLEQAIVEGDRVAFAVDPNVPQLAEVLDGAVQAVSATPAAAIDVVLAEEASDPLVAQLKQKLGERVTITRHDSASRPELRYLAASRSADPIYLNRQLIDADVIVPVMVARPLDKLLGHDLTGIFPAMSDSATRHRHRQASRLPDQNANEDLTEIGWQVGVQIMLSVEPSESGRVGRVVAGTLDAISKQISGVPREPDHYPPAAPMVLAILSGDTQQQNWCNAARAIEAAERFVSPNGIIVLWSQIEQSPSSSLTAPTDHSQAEPDFVPSEDQPFPRWDETAVAAEVLARVVDEHRVLVHSRVDDEQIESMGLGVVANVEELQRLSRSFPACGVLQAAQFAGSNLLAHHALPENS